MNNEGSRHPAEQTFHVLFLEFDYNNPIQKSLHLQSFQQNDYEKSCLILMKNITFVSWNFLENNSFFSTDNEKFVVAIFERVVTAKSYYIQVHCIQSSVDVIENFYGIRKKCMTERWMHFGRKLQFYQIAGKNYSKWKSCIYNE